MEIGLFTRIVFMTVLMILLMIPNTQHVWEERGVRLNLVKPLVPNISLLKYY